MCFLKGHKEFKECSFTGRINSDFIVERKMEELNQNNN